MIEVGYFALIFFSAFSLGKKILERFKLNINFFEVFIFSSALGMGIFSYVTLFLGIFGLLYKSIILFLIVGILLFSKNELLYLVQGSKLLIKQIKKLGIGTNLVLIIILFIFILINLIASLSPPYLWDEVAYNIALPKVYAHHHKIIPIYDEFRSHFPFNINILFTIGILIANASLSKLFMFGYGTLLALAIFTFSRKYFSLRTGLLSALIYYTMPMVSNHISSTYIDIGVAFYIFMAYYSFYIWFETNKINWFLLSSIMTGLSLASKHTAIYFIPPLFFGLGYKLFFKDKNISTFFNKTAFYFLVVFLLVSPWYAKSYIHTGDPIFPFGYSLFKSEYWDIIKNQNLIKSNFLESDKKTFVNFLIKFWDLTMHSSTYGMLLGFGPVFLAFIPLIILMRRVNKVTRYLLICSIISMTIWFFNPQVLRYLMVYPMLSVISGDVIDSLLKIKQLKKLVMLLLASTLIFNLILWYGANSIKLPYVFGLESEQDFYLKLKDDNGYNVFKYANENLPKNSKLLLFKEARGYLSNLDYVVGDPLTQKVIDYSKIWSSEDLYKGLKSLNITHVFINTKVAFYNSKQSARYSEREVKLMNELLQQHGKLLFSDRGVYLYELV